MPSFIHRLLRNLASLTPVLFAAGVLSMASPALADNVFTPRDVARLRAASSPIISPNGRHIAYLQSVQRDPYADPDSGETKFSDGPPYMELHVIDLPDGEPRPFITGEVSIGGVSWSPDSKAILFLDKRGKDENKCLYRLPVDGGEARRVLSHQTDILSYSLSPDGTRAAFRAEDKKPKNKKELEEKGFKAEIYEEDLSPVRLWVAILDQPTEKPRKLDIEGSVVRAYWSPAGDQLALAVAPSPLIDDVYMQSRVQVVDANTGEVICKLDNPGKLGPLAWSPDGRHVAMISAEDINDPSEGRLMIAPATGGPLKDLLPKYLGHVNTIAWQDTETVMYIGDEGVSTVFAKVRIDGSERKVLAGPGDLIMNTFTLSKDGQKGAFLADSAAHPSEVYYMQHNDTSPRRLTDSNPWLADMRLARQEVVTFKARDGLDLEGILIRPLDEKPGGKYPLILYVHGGPEAHEQNGWMTNYGRPGQIAAARGFAVFYPNYRGSTGRGVAFSKLGQQDEAGKEFDDLVDAVEHFVSNGLVDRKRVGITGGSYGGYASAWGATALTEHFAASVMFVGISNTISKKGTTDIPNEDFLVHARTRMWDGNWQFHLERSPIYYVKKARTPILILHGKEDPRVHPSQSMELYRHLKTIGEVPVRLVWYPGEGHGNRKAAGRLDYNMRMMQWLEHYLIGPGGEPPAIELDYGFKESTKAMPTETDEEPDKDART